EDGSSTQSLISDVVNHRFENRRRYHGYRAGSESLRLVPYRVTDKVQEYPLPNDDTEQARLDLMHEASLLTFHGKLVLHPETSNGGRVLDLGTGTGIWAVDYGQFARDFPLNSKLISCKADKNLDAHVIGVDLSPIQHEWTPSNCTFEIDDIEEDWTLQHKFRLIFCRSMIGAITDWQALAQKAFQNLEPGGYFEIQDHLYPLFGNDRNDGKFEKTHLHEWSVNMVEAAKRSGRPIDVAPRFTKILEDAGFIAVTEETRPVPIGGWPRDPTLKLIGRIVGEMLTDNLEGISSALFTRNLKWTEEEMRVYLARVRKDLRVHDMMALSRAYVVWGRKPLDAEP
ncbi:hypothetical protein TOPH_02811, partial [Tolypocladium ophioglossoides CBS 100239]